MYGLTIDTVKLLQESAPLMDSWSDGHCACKQKFGMEEWAKKNAVPEKQDEVSCGWYHGTWQYMRLMNMVAVPNWYGFYNKAISDVLKRKPEAHVFISACADYGMLAKVHEAMIEAKANPKITIYDICKTPLKSCEWYAEKFGLAINCRSANILTDNIPEAPFDLIVTDEFLSVLKDEYKPMATKKWKELLKPDGVLITTAMMGKPTTDSLRKGFADKASTIVDTYDSMLFAGGLNGSKDAFISKLEKFAAFHTRHMLQSEDMLRNLFKDYERLEIEPIVTPGECVNPTVSFQIIASPRAKQQ